MHMHFRALTKGTILAVISTSFLGACSISEAVPPFDTDRYLSSWIRLWNTYDLALVDELFLTDSTVTYFSSEREGLITGIEDVRSHHEGFGFVAGGRAAEQELWVDEIHTAVHGPAAIVTGLWFFGLRDSEPEQIQRGPFTFVYVLKSGEYRLAHLNFGTYLATTGREGN